MIRFRVQTLLKTSVAFQSSYSPSLDNSSRNPCNMLSPELETLDQLAGGDLSLAVVASFYPGLEGFKKGVLGLLGEGDVVLLDSEGRDVPQWRWRELFSEAGLTQALREFRLRITPQGGKKV